MLVMGGGLSGRPTKCRCCQYQQLRDIGMANIFSFQWAINGCVIASDMLFDSWGEG